MATKKTKRSVNPHQSPVKRAKTTSTAVEDFSLDRVVGSVKKASVEYAHLPANTAEQLFGQDATISYLTTDHSSWVYHVPHWYQQVFKHDNPSEDEERQTWSAMFKQAWDAHPEHYESIMMFGKPTKIPRFQMLCGEMGSYRFSGMTYEAQPKFPRGLEHAVEHMKHIVEDPDTHNSKLTGGLVNWYANGDHYIGPHADDERDMIAGSPIVALSLGATRRFVFTKKTPKNAPKDEKAVSRLELQVGDGDLLIMGGTTQKTHKHAVPKMAKCREPRLSVTLRCFH